MAIFQADLSYPFWDYIGAKDDGGVDSCSYKACKAPVKSSPSTDQHPTFYRPDALEMKKMK